MYCTYIHEAYYVIGVIPQGGFLETKSFLEEKNGENTCDASKLVTFCI